MVLRLRQPAPGQWRKAKCLGMVKKDEDGTLDDPFFDSNREDEAISICRTGPECPLLHDCLIFALVNNEKSGCWGGHGEADRKAIRKQWPLRRGKTPRPEWDVFKPGEPAGWFEPEELTDEDDPDDD